MNCRASLLSLGRNRLPSRARATGESLLLLLSAVLPLGGCALNDHGLVRVRRFENDSAVILRVTAIGVHLITAWSDGGLTLGYSDRTYVFPRADASVRIPLPIPDDPEQWEQVGRVSLVDTDLPPVDAPILRMARTGGLSVDTNARRIGVSLGYGHRSALWLPTDGSRVVLIRHAAGNDAGARVFIYREGTQ